MGRMLPASKPRSTSLTWHRRSTSARSRTITANGLLLRRLRRRKLGYRLLVGGIACQVKSAQTLDGDDTAVGQQLNTAVDNGVAGLARGADGRRRGRLRRSSLSTHRLAPRNMRPAIKAGIGLRVKTPVEWVGILRGALGTHGKTIHRRGRSVIRQRSDDGKARAAVSAVDKGVVIASVGGIEQLAQTIVAGGDIGRDERRVRGLVLRCYDAKTLFIGSASQPLDCQVHNLDIALRGLPQAHAQKARQQKYRAHRPERAPRCARRRLH